MLKGELGEKRFCNNCSKLPWDSLSHYIVHNYNTPTVCCWCNRMARRENCSRGSSRHLLSYLWTIENAVLERVTDWLTDWLTCIEWLTDWLSNMTLQSLQKSFIRFISLGCCSSSSRQSTYQFYILPLIDLESEDFSSLHRRIRLSQKSRIALSIGRLLKLLFPIGSKHPGLWRNLLDCLRNRWSLVNLRWYRFRLNRHLRTVWPVVESLVC